MKIGVVAKLSKVSTRTIDYYTTCGLLDFERSDANYRLYPASVLHTLERIQLLKHQRMSIAEIKQVLTVDHAPETEKLIEDVMEEFNFLQQKITNLEEHLKDAPSTVKMHVSRALESKLAAMASLLALL